MSAHDAELFVRVQLLGFHCWPDAPEHRSYLRDRHRHIFHILVRMPVAADDSRDVEYHDLLDKVRWTWGGPEKGASSCETLARELATELAAWARRPCTAVVSEDGEAGASYSAAQEPCSQPRSAPGLVDASSG